MTFIFFYFHIFIARPEKRRRGVREREREEERRERLWKTRDRFYSRSVIFSLIPRCRLYIHTRRGGDQDGPPPPRAAGIGRKRRFPDDEGYAEENENPAVGIS